MERAAMSGQDMAAAQANIAQLTTKYAADLKTVQAIVGKNAEAEMEKARALSMSTNLQSEYSKDQKEGLQAVLASFGQFGPQADKLRLAFGQLAQGGEITDAAVRNDPAIMAMLENAVKISKAGGDTASATLEFQKVVNQSRDTALAEAQDANSQRSQMAKANAQLGAGSDALLGGFSAMSDALLLPKTSAEELAKQQADLKKQQESGGGPETKQMDAITQNQQKLSVALEQAATSAGALKVFGDAVTTAQGAVQTLIDKINGVASGKPVTDTATSIKDTAMMAVGAAMPFAMDIANKIKGPIDVAKSGATVATVATDATKTGATVVGDVAKTAAVAETKVVANAGEKTAAAALKAGGSAMGKTALKAIPFVGLGLSLWDAASRVKDGDYLGAAIAAGGGVASMFPGIGTGLAIAADAANLARDVTGVTKSGGEGISDAEKTKAMTDAKAEMDRESSRGRGLSTTASIEEAKALDAANKPYTPPPEPPSVAKTPAPEAVVTSVPVGAGGTMTTTSAVASTEPIVGFGGKPAPAQPPHPEI
jgi:hypothetical protein